MAGIFRIQHVFSPKCLLYLFVCVCSTWTVDGWLPSHGTLSLFSFPFRWRIIGSLLPSRSRAIRLPFTWCSSAQTKTKKIVLSLLRNECPIFVLNGIAASNGKTWWLKYKRCLFQAGLPGPRDPNFAHISPQNVLYYIRQGKNFAQKLGFYCIFFNKYLRQNVQNFAHICEMGDGSAHLATLLPSKELRNLGIGI